MELHLTNNDEIALPAWLAGTSLSLTELGAIVVLACLNKDGDNPILAARFGASEMREAVNGLKTKGVFKVSIQGSNVTVNIDIDAAREEAKV